MLPSHALRKPLLLSILLSRPWHRLAIVFGAFAATLLGITAPYFQKEFVDGLLEGQPDYPAALIAFACMASFAVFQQASLWVAAREASISQKSLSDLLYSRLLSVRGGLIGRKPAGEAISLFAVDVQGAAMLLEQTLTLGVAVLFPLLAAPWFLSAWFGLPLEPIWITLGIITLINFWLGFRQSNFFTVFKELAAERTGQVNEWIQNIRTLRVLGWMRAFESAILETRVRETVNRVRMVTNGQFMNMIAGSATYILNCVALAALVSFKPTPPTPGELLALLWTLGVFLYRPLRQFPWIFVMSMDAVTSLRRIDRALEVKFEDPENEHQSAQTHPSPPAIDCRDLRLSIGGKEILKGISVGIRPGEFVAVVGEIGSGKSQFLQSLIGETSCRFGSYRLHGREVQNFDSTEFRKHFAFISQDGLTISTSLRDNVAFKYAHPTDDDARISSVLRLAAFAPAAEGLGKGLDTQIGERGVNLSGGQRQRIGLARAAYSTRPILILDDSLSAVDIQTEEEIFSNLLQGAWSRHTRLMATHRMKVLPVCDRILLFQGGRIIAEGDFEQLKRGSKEFLRLLQALEQAPPPAEELLPTPPIEPEVPDA